MKEDFPPRRQSPTSPYEKWGLSIQPHGTLVFCDNQRLRAERTGIRSRNFKSPRIPGPLRRLRQHRTYISRNIQNPALEPYPETTLALPTRVEHNEQNSKHDKDYRVYPSESWKTREEYAV